MNLFLLAFLLSETFVIQANKHGHHTIRGERLKVDQYPFFAQISIPRHINHDSQLECGGTLIDPMWILTAAHCFMDSTEIIKDLAQHKIKVFMGTNKHLAHAHDAAINFVHKVYVHPKFSRFEDSCPVYDIAVVQLKYAYKLSSHIQTLYLPQSKQNGTSERCKIGITIGIGNNSKYMLTASVHEKAIQQLESKIPKPVTENLFFTEVLLKNSGGPYLCLDENGIYVQYGVRSKEDTTDNVTDLAMYEAVDAHIDFVIRQVPNISIYKKTPLWYLKETGQNSKTAREPTGIGAPSMYHERNGSVSLRYRSVVLITCLFIIAFRC